MENRNQYSSGSFSYLLFASVIMIGLIVLSGSALSAPAWSSEEAVAAPSNSPADDAGATHLSNTINSVSPQVNQGVLTQNQVEPAKGPRNLSLQPEAFKVSRRFGRRFWDRQRTISVATGTLTVGGTTQAVQLVRRQTEHGEAAEIGIGPGAALLSWNESDGAKASGQRANDIERKLIERLILDSPDQLVLAQLRGASYYTVARNVRPVQADEDYRGALWDIVRVDDPDQDERRRPQSRWRLYYINSRTGLVDKVVSEIQGEQIEATFSQWRDRAGEKFPTHIVWARQGETVMEFSLLNFSSTSAQ